ncbi:MAG: tetratricopeptide repeat protein [Candidatus Marinimicrobia bacterium]|nr:tetratricopeptide repeat protein [Candidatus Neomarinimicrobiota bacterium]
MKQINLLAVLLLTLLVSGVFAGQEIEIDSLKQILRNTSEGETVDLLNQLAEAHAGQEWEKSQRYANLALDLATSLDDKYGMAVAHTNLANYYNMDQNYRQALDHAALALGQFEQLSDDWQIARTLRTIGTTYSLLNQSDQSLDYFLRSLMIFEDINREKEVAATVISIGDVYTQWGQAEKALRFFERALSIYRIDDDYKGILLSGNRLARSLMSLKRYDEAREYLEEMLRVSDDHGTPHLKASIYSSLGELYYSQLQLNIALQYFMDALEIKKNEGDKGQIALALSDVARVHLEAGDSEKALSFYMDGERLAQEAGESNISAEIWLLIGELHMGNGLQQKTVDALLSGLNIAQSVQDLPMIQRANSLLTEAYGRFGQPGKALIYQKALQTAIDELNRQQSNRRVAELEIRYELDKMDKEIDDLRGSALIDEMKYKRRYAMMIVVIAFSIVIMVLLVVFVFYRSSLIRKTEKEKMEQALRLKADFTAMLVHDLRSPLTAVFGFAELLKMGEKPYEQIREIAKTIRVASQKMLQLVNEMLDLSKFEAGKMALSKTDVTLKPIVSTSIQMLDPVANNRNMEIVFEAENGLPTCHCDVLKIEQVITNFISNAINHVPKGSLITVRLKEIQEQGQSFLHFSVADNGPGIPEDQRGKLFDKYAQLESRASDKSSGTGLGLAVSRIIVEEHGGKIGYEENEPHGSIFYFQIPREDVRAEAKVQTK